ncbi:MAG TPA: hypothetical protein VJ063_11615, partial [Verrucomicrobiae bacterium]|nr:hypothetical protein [Verrucomicrobiae bacterium]
MKNITGFADAIGCGKFATVKLIVVSLLAGAFLLRADDWPQWLGPKRDGIWRERGILREFPSGGPKVRWRAAVGAGYA